MEKLNPRMKLVAELAKNELERQGIDGSHDWHHVERVLRRSYEIVAVMPEYREQSVNLDLDIVIATAILHDVADHKYNNGDYTAGASKAREIMREVGFEQTFADAVVENIVKLPWSTGQVPNSIEGKIVQDADRLDAIGAIGTARCLMYNGAKGKDIGKAIAHHYEKLLRIPERLNTMSARALSRPLVRNMETILMMLETELSSPSRTDVSMNTLRPLPKFLS